MKDIKEAIKIQPNDAKLREEYEKYKKEMEWGLKIHYKI